MKTGIIILTNLNKLKADAVHVKNLLQSFDKLNFQYDLITSSTEDKQYKFKLLNIFKKIIGRCVLMTKVYSRQKEFSAFYLRDWFFAYLLSFLNIKYIFEVNGLLIYEGLIRGYARPGSLRIRILRIIENRVAKNANKIVCVSRGMKNYLVNQYNANKDNILVAPNAANLDVFNNNVQKVDLCLDEDDFIVGWTGSFDAYHGISDLIEIAKLLRDNNQRHIKFLIVGDGKEKERILKITQTEKINHYFVFVGAKQWKEVPSYISNADICLSLDKRSTENLEYRNIIGVTTVKVYEYLALGKPVLAYQLGDAKDFYEGQKVGWVCQPSVAKLYKKIIEISNNSKQIEEFSHKALQTAIKDYNWDKTAKKIIDFILQN
ncbi:glycosyltransferase family 4 protein [Patescibacteria group bacterium]|nr:glycosyltransferase family 4 protein [Patescibacteria group bacterium]